MKLQIATDTRDYVQNMVLFAALLCESYINYTDFVGPIWFLPIYFGDKPNGVAGLVHIGVNERHVAPSVLS